MAAFIVAFLPKSCPVAIMADKKLAEKLQVKHGRRLALIDAPAGMAALFAPEILADTAESAEVVLGFVRSRAELERALPRLAARPAPTAILWLAYPKLGTPLAGDLNRDVIHGFVPGLGLDTVAQIAIDATWSAMRLKLIPR
jgi:hypothetical protein